MYVYQSGLIDFLSILFLGYLVYLGILTFLQGKQIKKQQEEIDCLKRQFFRLKKSIKNDDSEDYEEYEFMNQKFSN